MDEENLLKFLVKNNCGFILTLDDLQKSGKIFLYYYKHLLIKDNGKNNFYKTFLFLKNDKNINVGKINMRYYLLIANLFRPFRHFNLVLLVCPLLVDDQTM